MLAIRTILHPTDFSEPSQSAWQFAASLANCYGANLVILHVIPTSNQGDDVNRSTENGVSSVSSEMTTESVDGNAGRTPEATNPASEILQIARSCHADLIVMGAHGQYGLEHLAMGHVAEQVLLGATCPVLTVTIPEPQAEGTCVAAAGR
jgi:nucleotide-binding universal stress UspA family protein